MATTVAHTEFFVTGGTVPLTAESYVERAADNQLLEALTGGKFCYVLNSRQMGKSSLCVRSMAKLREGGVRTALVDLTKIGGRNVTPEQWYAGLVSDIGRELNLRAQVLAFWKENAHLSPMQRFFAALREVAMEDQQALIIFIDEIDTTRSLAFSTDEFFAGIRECYNRRAQDPEYNRLSFCLLGVAVPSDLIQDAKTTPFNIGERIYLRDFTLEEAMVLGEGLGERATLVKRVHYWTNGHPFLTQSLCLAIEKDSLIKSDKDVDALIETELFQPKARKSHINLADVGNRVLNSYADGEDADKYKADVLSAYRKALKGRQQLADDETNRISAALKLSGLMRSEGNALVVRNRIYEHVFGEDWIRENMPGREVRRQKRAFWMGVLRATLVSVAITALISKMAVNNAALAKKANELAEKERIEKNQAQYQAYVADVNEMQMAAESQDSKRLQRLLSETANSPFKNFEWRYWNAQLNNSQYKNDFPTGPGFMAIAADGRSCAVEDYRLRKVEILSLPDLKLIESHSIPKRDVFVWQLGKKWVGAAFDGSWKFDDLTTGLPFGALSIPGGNLNWISGPPSTNFIAAPWEKPGDSGWRHVGIWSVSNLQLVKNLSFDFSINGTVSISNDGRTLAIIEQAKGPRSPNKLCAIDVATGKVLDSADLSSEYYLNTPRLSLDGSRMAASDDSGLVVVRDIASHKSVFQKSVGHNLVSLDLSSDGREIVTLEGYLCEVWDLATGKILLRKTGCLSPDLSPDGHYLIDAGVGTRVYQLGKEDVETAPAPDNSAPFQATSSGRWLMGSVTTLSFLDPISLKTIKTMPFNGVAFMSLTGQGKYILGRAKDGSASVFESESGRLICRLPKETAGNLGASEDGKVFAREDQDYRTLHVFDSGGREVWKHKLNSASFFDAVSPNGKLVATGLYTGDVDIFDAATGKVVRELTEPSMCIRALAFSRDSRLLAVGGDEATVFIYNLEKPGPPVECNVNAGDLLFLSFSPDGSRLLATGLNQLASLWDSRTGDEVMTFGDSSSKVNRAMFNQSGDQICTLDEHSVLHVYRAP